MIKSLEHLKLIGDVDRCGPSLVFRDFRYLKTLQAISENWKSMGKKL
jgi:hypothetical protein